MNWNNEGFYSRFPVSKTLIFMFKVSSTKKTFKIGFVSTNINWDNVGFNSWYVSKIERKTVTKIIFDSI